MLICAQEMYEGEAQATSEAARMHAAQELAGMLQAAAAEAGAAESYSSPDDADAALLQQASPQRCRASMDIAMSMICARKIGNLYGVMCRLQLRPVYRRCMAAWRTGWPRGCCQMGSRARRLCASSSWCPLLCLHCQPPAELTICMWQRQHSGKSWCEGS